MQIAAIHLAPVLAAEKSKVPFYIAGGLLVVWALFVSMGLGRRLPEFPRNLREQRTVVAITAVLVLAAVSTAVITSSPPANGPITTHNPPLPPTPSIPPVENTASTAAGAVTAAAGGGATHAAAPAAAAAHGALSLAADPGGQLSYNTKQLSAKAGKVTISMTNMSPVEHNVTVAQGTTVLGATPTFTGGSRILTLTLKPGKYTFYCSVPGHRQAGMEGTLTVS